MLDWIRKRLKRRKERKEFERATYADTSTIPGQPYGESKEIEKRPERIGKILSKPEWIRKLEERVKKESAPIKNRDKEKILRRGIEYYKAPYVAAGKGAKWVGSQTAEGLGKATGGAYKVRGAGEGVFDKTIDVISSAVFGSLIAGGILIGIYWLFTGIILEMNANSWLSLLVWLVLGVFLTMLLGAGEEESAINVVINNIVSQPPPEKSEEEEQGKGGGEVQHDEKGTHGEPSGKKPGGRAGM